MNWNNVQIVPTFVDQGVSCYQLEDGDFKNEYYIVSEAETRKLLNNPEIVGYETYYCLIPSTSQMLYYFKEKGNNCQHSVYFTWGIELSVGGELLS